MALYFNTDKALNLYKQKGGTTQFIGSLETILKNAKKDENINDVRELAYLLATAKKESDYSLQRWESDYLCGRVGQKYTDKPCSSAINYYCSTQGGKKNYCIDTDELDPRGLPYFGRGLINLTSKWNYDKYGRKIGVGDKLVNNPDLALEPTISYRIATSFMNDKKGSSKKSVFDYVKEGDFTKARRLVNGGSKGLLDINKEYNKWIEVLLNSDLRKGKIKLTATQVAVYSSIIITFVAIGFVAWKYSRKNIKG